MTGGEECPRGNRDRGEECPGGKMSGHHLMLVQHS